VRRVCFRRRSERNPLHARTGKHRREPGIEHSDGKLLPGGITHRNHADPDHLLPKRERQRSQGHKLMNPAMEAGARRSGDDFGETGADVVSHLHPEIQP
jgi:hypothetical protein